MKNKFLLLLIAGLISVLGTGCILFVGAAAGAGGYAWYSGELKSSEAVSYEKAISATQAAMKSLGYAQTEMDKDALRTKITFRGAGDEKAVVTLNKLSSNVTEIRVRVGVVGDRAKSTGIMDAIKQKF
ncbi:MAG: DUF3568 family protein [Verrucomicrobia bacterium]|nr:MAG: DUF3568 family protein [Verrucomicrobiota bacterium]